MIYINFLTIFDSILEDKINLQSFLIVLFCSLISGIIVSLVYLFTHKKEIYNQSMPITILIMPILVSMVLALVGNNVAGAFSLMGVFSLIRFRSEQGSLKDIAYLFIGVASGLALGLGFIAYGFLVCFLLSIVLILLSYIHYGEVKSNMMCLKIVVPENLNYQNIFDEVIKKYTKYYKLEKIRTTDFGTMFELRYIIIVNKNFNSHQMIDEIRCLNGNLNVTLNVTSNSLE